MKTGDILQNVSRQFQGLYNLAENLGSGVNNFYSLPMVQKTAGFLTHGGPLQLLSLFILSSLVMIWRLNAVEKKGFEGTAMGTLIMPFFSGFANIAFAWVIGKGGGSLVLENCIVNNVTNLTLLLGLPALIWGLDLSPENDDKRMLIKRKTDRLSLDLSIIAMLFFTGVLWSLGRDGELDLGDGLVLVGIFLFWQIFQVFDLTKANIRKNSILHPSIILDLIITGLGAWGVCHSIDSLLLWLEHEGTGMFISENAGWLSGFLMVLPNGLLAFYYGAAKRAEIVYTSQIGDGHICIPMCIGLFAVFSPMKTPSFFELGIIMLSGAGVIHLLFAGLLGKLPRAAGALLVIAYFIFLYRGLPA